MPDDRAGQYRQKSQECREEAQHALTEADRRTWLTMADEWLALAHSVEENEALADRIAEAERDPEAG